MPIIKVHRGLDQIGGCITEISTETSRVFIDFGQNLPGVGEPTTPEEDQLLVNDILASNPMEHQAVFYTHAHEDHVGLSHYIPDSIPQYIGEGGKEILMLKNNLIVTGNELSGDPDKINAAKEKLKKIDRLLTWPKPKSHKRPDPIIVGDIKVTPFFCCHSIYDAYMFLIEADDKRIWHTGDYRGHGYMSKGLYPTLERYATNIDTLITEGTMLNRDEVCIHESEVSDKMVDAMKSHKYVFVLTSGTDIERLASIKEAAKNAHKPLYVCAAFVKGAMEIFSHREAELSHGLFRFSPHYFTDRSWNTIRERGMVLIVGTSQLERVEAIKANLPEEETLLIYSTWDGYYKLEEQIAINPNYKLFHDLFENVEDIHTSGHADKDTIHKVIDTIKPKEVICIHKEAGAKL